MPAAEHAVELVDVGGHRLALPVRRSRRCAPGRGDSTAAPARRRTCRLDVFDERVPVAAAGALPRPLRVRRAALAAHVHEPDLARRVPPDRSGLLPWTASGLVRGGVADLVAMVAIMTEGPGEHDRRRSLGAVLHGGSAPWLTSSAHRARAVDRLADDVGVAGVLGGLGDDVEEHPARRPAWRRARTTAPRGADATASRSGSVATRSSVRRATSSYRSSRQGQGLALVHAEAVLVRGVAGLVVPAASPSVPKTMKSAQPDSVNATCLIRPPTLRALTVLRVGGLGIGQAVVRSCGGTRGGCRAPRAGPGAPR